MRMHRRTLLKSMAAAAGVAAACGRAVLRLKAAARLSRRVRPTDAAWPGAASWQKLKDAVGGNLIEVQALFGACPADPKGPDCADALKNLRNPF